MRFIIIIMTALLVQASAAGLAQNVTYVQKNASLEQVFNQITRQTGLNVLLPGDKLNIAQKLDANFKNASVNTVLNQTLSNLDFTYVIEDNTIVIKPKEPSFLDRLADRWANIDVRGRVLDEQKNPLTGATVRVKGVNQSTVANDKGEFYLPNVSDKAVLVIAYVGYAQKEVKVEKDLGDIVLSLSNNKLEEVNVTVNTGYQTLSKERATGSFTQVDNKLINRSVGTSVLSRLDGVTSGLLFNKFSNLNGSSRGKDPSISIRGRSTLFANTEPLIVLDNFPYSGDLNNINPNDVESITILKDAAAASIWGTRAGNGVIVITSKKGKNNQAPEISLNTNTTITGKPNLFDVPQMSSSEFIEFEKFLFDNGYYDLNLDLPSLAIQPQSQVIDILDNEKKGIIGHDDAKESLERLARIDGRRDYTDYFLRNAFSQQYSLSINGGSSNNQYYISGGYDRNISNLVSDSYSRKNLSFREQYRLFKDKLDLSTSILYTNTRSKSNPMPYTASYPYEALADDNGNALSVIRDYRQKTKDALSNLGLLEWNYYPLSERFNNSTLNTIDYRVGIQMSYKILPKLLNIDLNYQYQGGKTSNSIINNENIYSTRLLINKYAQIDPTGSIVYPVPKGAIARFENGEYRSNAGRIQLNYHQTFEGKHEIVALAGSEVSDNNGFLQSNFVYGYNESTGVVQPVDYFTDYNLTIPDEVGRLPFRDVLSGNVDRFLSYYANASYSYLDRYILSASARKDKSNLFGVDANMKGVPLYSYGLAWSISNEKFYKFSLFPYLRLRVTDGYNGNLSKNLSAYLTATTAGIHPVYSVPQDVILNPPNPSLRWERVHITNLGLDFGSKSNRISGSLDYYSKVGKDLIGNSPIPSQTGVIQFTGNTASIATKGLDVSLNSINTRGKFGWSTNFLINFVKDKVIEYKIKPGVNQTIVETNYANPVEGKPYSAIFAYEWAGLDAVGDPQGILDGQVTKDYTALLNSTDINNLKYIGTANPTVFGSLRNNFSFKNLELSFNILYKLGYYFRRGSFTSNTSYEQNDYSNRWKKSGDENLTNVPALLYPLNLQRSLFYERSEVLFEKGDHLRLQDIQFSYNLVINNSKLPFNKLKLYAYVSNLGILWRANKYNMDPDYALNGTYLPVNPKSFAIGMKMDF